MSTDSKDLASYGDGLCWNYRVLHMKKPSKAVSSRTHNLFLVPQADTASQPELPNGVESPRLASSGCDKTVWPTVPASSSSSTRSFDPALYGDRTKDEAYLDLATKVTMWLGAPPSNPSHMRLQGSDIYRAGEFEFRSVDRSIFPSFSSLGAIGSRGVSGPEADGRIGFAMATTSDPRVNIVPAEEMRQDGREEVDGPNEARIGRDISARSPKAGYKRKVRRNNKLFNGSNRNHEFNRVPCRYWAEGNCRKGDECNFSHGQSKLTRKPSLQSPVGSATSANASSTTFDEQSFPPLSKGTRQEMDLAIGSEGASDGNAAPVHLCLNWSQVMKPSGNEQQAGTHQATVPTLSYRNAFPVLGGLDERGDECRLQGREKKSSWAAKFQRPSNVGRPAELDTKCSSPTLRSEKDQRYDSANYDSAFPAFRLAPPAADTKRFPRGDHWHAFTQASRDKAYRLARDDGAPARENKMDSEYPALLSVSSKEDRTVPKPNKMQWSQALKSEPPAGHRKVCLRKSRSRLQGEQGGLTGCPSVVKSISIKRASMKR